MDRLGRANRPIFLGPLSEEILSCCKSRCVSLLQVEYQSRQGSDLGLPATFGIGPGRNSALHTDAHHPLHPNRNRGLAADCKLERERGIERIAQPIAVNGWRLELER